MWKGKTSSGLPQSRARRHLTAFPLLFLVGSRNHPRRHNDLDLTVHVSDFSFAPSWAVIPAIFRWIHPARARAIAAPRSAVQPLFPTASRLGAAASPAPAAGLPCPS